MPQPYAARMGQGPVELSATSAQDQERGQELPEPYSVHLGDALDAYDGWPVPATIISDGAYGLRLFLGDLVIPTM